MHNVLKQRLGAVRYSQDATRTVSNHLIEIIEVLGIEAARNALMKVSFFSSVPVKYTPLFTPPMDWQVASGTLSCGPSTLVQCCSYCGGSFLKICGTIVRMYVILARGVLSCSPM